MTSKILTGIILLLFIISVLPAAAQDAQCVEYQGYDTLYQVNLDTGEITASDLPIPTMTSADNDEAFTVTLQQNESPVATYTLTLTDNLTGISVIFARTVTTYQVHWSPDGLWLAYVELDELEAVQYLRLFNVETGEIISTLLDREYSPRSNTNLSWSPDSNLIMVSLIVGNKTSLLSELHAYSIPNLTHLTAYTFEPPTAMLAFVRWSPSGNHLAVDFLASTFSLVDISSWEIYTAEIGGSGYIAHEYFWSSDGSYLAITSFYTNNAYENLKVVNMQGESVLETIINKVSASPRWLNDSQLLVATDEPEENLQESYDFDYDLTLFDLQTGEQYLILEQPGGYLLSQDQRYLTSISNDDPHILQLFDLTQTDQFLIDNIMVDTDIHQYIWRSDRLELIVLFEDMSLRAYDLETREWRAIANVSHPGDDQGMYQVVCTA